MYVYVLVYVSGYIFSYVPAYKHIYIGIRVYTYIQTRLSAHPAASDALNRSAAQLPTCAKWCLSQSHRTMLGLDFSLGLSCSASPPTARRAWDSKNRPGSGPPAFADDRQPCRPATLSTKLAYRCNPSGRMLLSLLCIYSGHASFCRMHAGSDVA